MNLESFLKQATAEGDVHSEGHFTTNVERMLSRLSDSLLVDAGLAPLVVVASSVAAGATGLDILPGKNELTFRFAMEEPCFSGEQGWTAAFSSGAARHLLLAAAVWRPHAGWVSVSFPSQGRRLVLTSEGLSLEAHSGGGLELKIRGTVPSRHELEQLMLRHCGLSPVPLRLAGKLLQSSLDKAYGQNGLWSKGVPEHLRPQGEPALEGETVMLLAPTGRVRPSWIAVVGGISYPFLLPEAPGVMGIVWSERLSTDMSFTGLVWNNAWLQVRDELLHQAARVLQKGACPHCQSGHGEPICPALREKFPTRVYLAGSSEFEKEAAGFHTAHQHRCLLAMAARDATDVVETVSYAREHGLRVAIQNTGHGVHEPNQQEVLLSMRGFRRLELDRAGRSVTVGAGVTWKSVFEAALPHDLVPIAGSSPQVGVIGYVLGGGLGPLARSHGFGSDYLEELTVVDGCGRVLRTSARDNSDLFWAFRGGKCGLGVVLEARLRLVEIPFLVAGELSFFQQGPELASLLSNWIAWCQSAPGDASTSFLMMKENGYPRQRVRFAYPGSTVEGRKLAGLLGEALGHRNPDLRPCNPGVLADLHGDPETPGAYRGTGMLLEELNPDFVRALLDELERRELLLGFELRHLGGATTRDVPEGSAVGGRTAKYTAHLVWNPLPLLPRTWEEQEAGSRGALASWVAAETNINWAGRLRDQEHFASAWPLEIRERLEKIRKTHDPDGIFSWF